MLRALPHGRHDIHILFSSRSIWINPIQQGSKWGIRRRRPIRVEYNTIKPHYNNDDYVITVSIIAFFGDMDPGGFSCTRRLPQGTGVGTFGECTAFLSRLFGFGSCFRQNVRRIDPRHPKTSATLCHEKSQELSPFGSSPAQ